MSSTRCIVAGGGGRAAAAAAAAAAGRLQAAAAAAIDPSLSRSASLCKLINPTPPTARRGGIAARVSKFLTELGSRVPSKPQNHLEA
jgi:hypothetical protein